MDDGLTDLLRRTLAAKAAEIEADARRPPAPGPAAIVVAPRSTLTARRPWWPAAAAIVAGAIAAAAIVAWRAGSSGDSGPQPPTGSSAPATVSLRPSGWYLPSRVPDGLVPVSAFARREPAEPSSPVRDVFVRTYADGTIEPRVWLSAYPDPGPMSPSNATATVHENPAVVASDQNDNGITTSTSVDWYESGWHVTLSARGSADAVALAERTTVDASGVQLDLTADGLERFDRSTVPAPPSDAFRTTVAWDDPADPNRRVELTVAPNVDRDTVDVLDAWPYDVADAGGRRAAIRQGRGLEVLNAAGGPALVVTWFRDGYVLTLRGSGLDQAAMVDLAASVRPSSSAAFDVLHRTASARALENPPVDEAVFPDGMTVSVRLVEEPAILGNARALLCAGSRQVSCGWGGSSGRVSTTGGDEEGEVEGQIVDVTGLFDVRGATTMLLWVRGTGDHPTVQAIGAGPPDVEAVSTATGWFLRITVPPGAQEIRVAHEFGAMGTATHFEVLDPPVS